MKRISMVMLMIIAASLTLMIQQSRADVLLEENFNTDVIGSGDWIASDASVSVDISNGWLHIGASGWGDWSDVAGKIINLTLPIAVEVRMRLVSGGDTGGGGGAGYTLPGIRLYCNPPYSGIIGITYLVADNYDWGWQFSTNEFSQVHTMGPQNANEWRTIKAIIRVDGGELLAKSDMDTEFTPIVTGNWSIPNEIVKLEFAQPWDAVCDFDYIRIEAAAQESSIWCDDFEDYSSTLWSSVWHGSGNVSGITVDNNIAYSGTSSLKMFGIIGSCWGAVATHPIQMDLPMEITFAVRNGDEPLSGCHPYHASFGIRTGGPDWWDCPCPPFLRFLPNGNIEIPWPAGEESEFSGFPLGIWHEVKCYLSTDGGGILHVEIWVNDQYLGNFPIPEESWMGEPVFVDIASQEGTVWFDDVCVQSNISIGAICASVNVNESPIQGVTVTVLDQSNDPVTDPQQTDIGGEVYFGELPVGEYSVMIVTPLGYAVSPAETQSGISVSGEDCAEVDFILTPTIITNDCRTIGYWKHQFDVYTSGRGHAQESEADLQMYLDLLDQHFNVLGVYMDLENFDFEDAKDILTVRGGNLMLDRAKQQLFALLLNFASGRIGNETVISDDGRVAAEAVTQVAGLINDSDPANDELAKDICDLINNGQMAEAGAIPESNIRYKLSLDGTLPIEFSLAQNFPNPFNASTTIKYGLPKTSQVTIEIYDIMGRSVETIFEGSIPVGYHSVVWNSGDNSSGIYFYKIRAGDYVDIKRMTLIK